MTELTTQATTAPTRIMLVDDHPLVRDGLRARLEMVEHFIIVAEADCAEEALEQAADMKINLALTDINLRSGSSGIELAARLSVLYPHIAVLMLSMHDKAEYVVKATQAGARGYVLKDAPGSDIITAIETVTAGGVYYSKAVAKHLEQRVPAAPLLTPRESEVLQAIASGKSSKQIAHEFELSVRTVETHRLNIKRKLGIEGQANLIRFALDQSDRG